MLGKIKNRLIDCLVTDRREDYKDAGLDLQSPYFDEAVADFALRIESWDILHIAQQYPDDFWDIFDQNRETITEDDYCYVADRTALDNIDLHKLGDGIVRIYDKNKRQLIDVTDYAGAVEWFFDLVLETGRME